jgi:hypothetical protein
MSQTIDYFPWWSRRSVKFITHFRSMPRLRMSGSLTPPSTYTHTHTHTHTFISCTGTILLSCRIPNAKEIKNSVFCLCATIKSTGSTQWRSWFRHCATSWKVAGSIPDHIVEIFHWHNPSGRIMTLEYTQPLTEMSTRNISWGKGGRCVGLTILLPSCVECLKIWEPQLPGTLRACPGQ